MPEPAATPSLCLCMMVCNEAHVIGRALRSVRNHIDYWIICDNGSTDATLPEIFNTLSGVPGQLHRTTWINFGHNRERTLRLAQGKGDYLLIMDADMILNVHAPFKHKLNADAYQIRYEGDCDYGQSMLVAARLPWRYVGATHEYITAPEASRPERMSEITLTHVGDGGMRADKFQRDEALLCKAVEDEPANARDWFYLAQTYFDTAQYAKALSAYRHRAAMDGWEEETWYSVYRAAECIERLGYSPEAVIAAFTQAFEMHPTRLEPLQRAVQVLRRQGEHDRAYEVARLGADLPYPGDSLFIDRALHQFGFLLEFAAVAVDTDHFAEATAAVERVLAVSSLPRWAYDEALTLLGKTSMPAPAGSLSSVPEGSSQIDVRVHSSEFLRVAESFEHDLARLRTSNEDETFCQAPIDDLRRIGSHATPAQKARRKETFFHPAIVARRHLGQGRHDVEEAITFAGADRDPNDQRTFGLHLPLHAKKHSIRHKVVSAGQRWNVSLRGDRWDLQPIEDIYVLLNIETLVLERDAELIVEGNILSLLCQRIFCAPGSRISILPTPFSVDARPGPHDGLPGNGGVDGSAGIRGVPLAVGGSILGPCLLMHEPQPGELAALTGGAGTEGGDGERGRPGRNGGMSKIAELTFRAVSGELAIFAQPGTGGDGGGGGRGGSGGHGGAGMDGQSLLSTRVAAGNGGAGGNGGNGGRGGNAGHGGLSANIYVSVPEGDAAKIRCVSRPGRGGRAGCGGAGGTGGVGGRGGRESHAEIEGREGQQGLTGAAGRSGLHGRDRPAPWIFLNEEPVCAGPTQDQE